MADNELQLQKNITSFCKFLPTFVEKWSSSNHESTRPLQTLANLTEQLRHVTSVKRLKCVEDFVQTKEILQAKIFRLIEEEITILKGIVDDMSKINHDLRNKLWNIERLSQDLDWEQDSSLIKGSGIQPSLERFLGKSLEFYNFFFNCGSNLSENFKNIDLYDEKSIVKFRDSFNFNLKDDRVVSLIALTQYVDNENKVV